MDKNKDLLDPKNKLKKILEFEAHYKVNNARIPPSKKGPKIVVWDICGAYGNSLQKALSKELYQVVSLDVRGSKGKFIYCDLSQPWNDVLKIINRMPKPDILAFSPPTAAFNLSTARKGGNRYFISKRDDEGKIYIAPPTQAEYLNMNWDVTKWASTSKSAKVHVRIMQNIFLMIKYITDYVNPYIQWYIEGPRVSYLWRYIEQEFTKATYSGSDRGFWGAYGGPILGDFKVVASCDLELRKTKPYYMKGQKIQHSSAIRLVMPKELVRYLVEHLMDVVRLEQFSKNGQYFI